MSSPFLPSPFVYSDAPQGGSLMPMIIAARAPSNMVDKQFAAGYFWLSSLDQFQVIGGVPVSGTGDLYYQAGNSAGTPNWIIVSSGSFATTLAASNKTSGTVALVAGTRVVSTTAVKADSKIRLTAQSLGTVVVPSALTVFTKTAGVSFTILASQATDTSTIFWEIV